MRRMLMVLVTALSLVLLEFVATASAAPGPVTGPSYTTGFATTALAVPGSFTTEGGGQAGRRTAEGPLKPCVRAPPAEAPTR